MTKWYTCGKWGFTIAYVVSFCCFAATNSDFWIYINLANAVFMFGSWFYEWYCCDSK